jgi:hypothetical protein
MAIIDLASKKKISELYAAQYALNFGLYQLGVLNRDVYEKYELQWSQKLVPEVEPKKLSVEELREKQRFDELTRFYCAVLNQWNTHTDNLEWVEKTVKNARRDMDRFPAAAEVVYRGELILQNRFLVGLESQVSRPLTEERKKDV